MRGFTQGSEPDIEEPVGETSKAERAYHEALGAMKENQYWSAMQLAKEALLLFPENEKYSALLLEAEALWHTTFAPDRVRDERAPFGQPTGEAVPAARPTHFSDPGSPAAELRSSAPPAIEPRLRRSGPAVAMWPEWPEWPMEPSCLVIRRRGAGWTETQVSVQKSTEEAIESALIESGRRPLDRSALPVMEREVGLSTAPPNFSGAHVGFLVSTSQDTTEVPVKWLKDGEATESWARSPMRPLPIRSRIYAEDEMASEFRSPLPPGGAVMFDAERGHFWTFETVLHSRWLSADEYARRLIDLREGPTQQFCVKCGAPRAPAEVKEEEPSENAVWRCFGCGLQEDVSFLLGYTPEGPRSLDRVDTTYVTWRDLGAPGDGVFEVMAIPEPALSAGYFMLSGALTPFEAVTDILVAVVWDRGRGFGKDMVLACYGDSQAFVPKDSVVSQDGLTLVPLFDSRGQQTYVRSAIPGTNMRNFVLERELAYGCRIVNIETSELLGMIHGSLKYRHLFDVPVAFDKWPSEADQDQLLREALARELVESLP